MIWTSTEMSRNWATKPMDQLGPQRVSGPLASCFSAFSLINWFTCFGVYVVSECYYLVNTVLY